MRKHRRLLARIVIVASSATSYPALFSAIAMGITTFVVVPVFAESPPEVYPACTDPPVTSCEGKEEWSACRCVNRPELGCACRHDTCLDLDAAVPDGRPPPHVGALRCFGTVDCEKVGELSAICKGKEIGVPCVATNFTGVCQPLWCVRLGDEDDKYRGDTILACSLFGADQSADAQVAPDASPSSVTPNNTDSSDSGCSSSNGTATSGALGMIFVVGFLLRMRRKNQPTKAPSSRKRS
jgi:hypothetical protein